MPLPSTFLAGLQNPYVHGMMGLLMAAAGLAEAIAPFLDEIQGNEAVIGAHHGVALYGIFVVLRSFGESMKGLRETREGLRSVATTLRGRDEERVTITE